MTFVDAGAWFASLTRFHVDTFGADMLDAAPPVLDAFIVGAGVAV